MVFGPFRSENGYTLCPFWSGIGYGSRGMVFEGGTQSMNGYKVNVFIASIPSE